MATVAYGTFYCTILIRKKRNAYGTLSVTMATILISICKKINTYCTFSVTMARAGSRSALESCLFIFSAASYDCTRKSDRAFQTTTATAWACICFRSRGRNSGFFFGTYFCCDLGIPDFSFPTTTTTAWACTHMLIAVADTTPFLFSFFSIPFGCDLGVRGHDSEQRPRAPFVLCAL